MYEFIEGEIVAKGPQRLVLKAGGIGYRLTVSNQTLSGLPPAGATALVFTDLQVREDDVSLYGFAAKEERDFFELLIQVSGVGPKLALTILSAYPVPALRKALVMGDLAVLTGISGIGKKTAQRMILELKDKLGKDFTADEAGITPGAGWEEGGGERDQAIAALEALGYSRPEILKAFAGRDVSGLDTEGMIKLGLKQLARF